MQKDTILRKIINKTGLNQKQFADKINYSESHISKIVNGKCPLTKEVKQRINEIFEYSIESMSDDADSPKDEVVTFYEYFEAIFEEITATPKNKNKDKKYLSLCMNKHLYDFFLNIDSAREREEAGGLCFEEEFDKFRKIYLENKKDYQNYILIPCNDMPELIEEKVRKRRHLDEVLELSDDINDYLDDDSKPE